jgi:hypothetical protein
MSGQKEANKSTHNGPVTESTFEPASILLINDLRNNMMMQNEFLAILGPLYREPEQALRGNSTPDCSCGRREHTKKKTPACDSVYRSNPQIFTRSFLLLDFGQLLLKPTRWAIRRACTDAIHD